MMTNVSNTARMKKILATLLFALGTSPGAQAVIYTYTGVNYPSLVSINETTLKVMKGRPQSELDGAVQLCTDQSNGKIFAVSGLYVVELSPTTLAVFRKWIIRNNINLKGVAAWRGVLYSFTGVDKPALVTLSESTLTVTGGKPQEDADGAAALAFDSTNGRLFAISSYYLIEFDPKTRKIIKEAPAIGTVGIAAHNGVIYTCTGYPTPGLVTVDEDTLQQTGGTVQSEDDGTLLVTVDPITGDVFTLSIPGVTEFDPTTLGIVNEQAFPGDGIGLGITVIPDPKPRR
jgi:hypothetical protein